MSVKVATVAQTNSAPITKTSAYTLLITDYAVVFNSASSIPVTFPSASANKGKEYMLKTIGTGGVVSPTSNIVPRTSATPGTAILTTTAGSWAHIQSDGTNWVILAGA